MAKYIIDVPASFVDITNGLHIPMDKQGSFRIDTGLKLTPYTEPERGAIENEVWNYVRKILWSFEDKEILGMDIAYAVRNMTYQEAKAKYDAWRKQKEEIRVGDELKDDENIRAVVLDILDEDYVSYEVFTENGIVDEWQKGVVAKTGRYFPEVAELLKKMRDTE